VTAISLASFSYFTRAVSTDSFSFSAGDISYSLGLLSSGIVSFFFAMFSGSLRTSIAGVTIISSTSSSSSLVSVEFETGERGLVLVY